MHHNSIIPPTVRRLRPRNADPYAISSPTSALFPNELATGTGAFFLVRFTGVTVGLACLSHRCVFSSELTCFCAQSIALGLDEFKPDSRRCRRFPGVW